MMHSNHIVHVLVSASTMAAGPFHVRAVKRSKDARYYGRHESGRYHMPGHWMTKAGKRMQMQRDFERCNRRKGRPR